LYREGTANLPTTTIKQRGQNKMADDFDDLIKQQKEYQEDTGELEDAEVEDEEVEEDEEDEEVDDGDDDEDTKE
jgi:hypothetical protein